MSKPGGWFVTRTGRGRGHSTVGFGLATSEPFRELMPRSDLHSVCDVECDRRERLDSRGLYPGRSSDEEPLYPTPHGCWSGHDLRQDAASTLT
jgi:hypothetical protein